VNDDGNGAHVEWSLATWNCFGAAQALSSFIRWRGAVDAHRFSHPVLREALGSTDVVCTQEVWLGDVEEFFEALPHPHKFRDRNHNTWWPPTVGGSGLAVASRYPIVQGAVRTFAGPKVHAERIARKGMLHVRVHLAKGFEVDVVSTHMQAGYVREAERVRAVQLEQLRAFADEVSGPTRPLFVCGDFNMCGLATSRAREYARLFELFRDYEDLFQHDDRPTFRPSPRGNALAHRFEPKAPEQRLDYVLYRAPSAPEAHTEIVRCELFLHEPLPAHAGGPETVGSDHDGLRVHLRTRVSQP
jgi:endonuclease/exonuclease/phosphatase family metal-dependent hydrolase